MLNALKKQPFFILAIPLFYVLHGFLDNFGFIGEREVLWVAGMYCLGAVITWLLLWLVFRDKIKAAALTAWFLLLYLFFGAYHDFLLRHAGPLSKYAVLLPLLLVLSVLVWVLVRRALSLQRAVLLLNLVFLVYLGLDIALLTGAYIHPPANKFSIFPSAQPSPAIPLSNKPDIYLLIFDEYGSSLSLQQNYGYHNSLDAYLQQQGFHIQANSFSNYNYTPASVASILNMSYLEGIKDSTLFTSKDMNYCLQLIRDNKVIDFLSREEYEIVNCSFFDLAKTPAAMTETLLPASTKLITANTLLSKLNNDLGWMLHFGSHRIRWLSGDVYSTRRANTRLLQMVKAQSSKKEPRPVFVYGHFYMPHDPFYYDKNGRLRQEQELQHELTRPAAPYLDYVTYTNSEIKKLIDTIQQNTQRKAVIVLMGDHGFRRLIEQNLRCNYQNLNAVYLPSQDYHQFYDSVTCVNQFKIVFNSIFHQSIPLLKDSSIFLSGKE